MVFCVWESAGLENAATLHGHPRLGKQVEPARNPCFRRFERYLEFLVALKK